MTESDAVLPPVPDTESVAPGLSQTQRVLYTFSSPSKTFTDILRNTSWWLPFVLGLIVTYGFVFAMQSRVGWEKLTESGMKQNPKAAERMANMPADQRAQAMQFSVMITKVITYSVPAIGLLFTAIFSLGIWATINFGFGGKSTFGQIFAVWMYGSLPLVIRSLLATITLFAGVDPDSFNVQNPVGTNIGYYLSQETPKWLMTLATSIDVFWIWSFVLVGIGTAIVAKVKRSAGLTAIFGWWLLILLIRVGIAAATS
jgi:hypothetical protein